MVEIAKASRVWPVLFGVTAWLLLTSCESVKTMRTADDLGTAAIQFDDIPVPKGLRLSTHRNCSHSHVVGAFRYGDFEYYGHVPVEDVVAYMTNRMTVHDWQLTATEASELATDLEFSRRPYVAKCQVWRDAAFTRMKVTVRTELVGSGSGDAAGDD